MLRIKDVVKDAVSLGFYAASRIVPQGGELVLSYHSVGRVSRKDDLYKMNVVPDLFEEQMRLIASLNKDEVIVSFDEGFSNIFEYAIPTVLRYNIKTIIFVTTDFIDGKLPLDSLFGKDAHIGPLSWEQIGEMSHQGIAIGSHTLSHPNLAKIDSKQALAEIKCSKIRLEDMLGREVSSFAYPFGSKGSFNQEVKQMIKESGYTKAYANILGFNNKNSDPYELKRMRVYSNDAMFRFKMKIRGAYNWVDWFLRR